MKVGDLVRVSEYDGRYKGGGHVWHEFVGRLGIVIDSAMRLHIPAFKVLTIDGILEFDHDELEIVCK